MISASAYIPLYMLDTVGKLLGKLLKPRLAAAITAPEDFVISSMDSVQVDP